MIVCENCRANGICDGIVGDCEQTDKIAGKIYQQGRADAIAEFKDLGKLYSEIRAEVFDEVIDLYNEMRGNLATNVYEFGERLRQLKEK